MLPAVHTQTHTCISVYTTKAEVFSVSVATQNITSYLSGHSKHSPYNKSSMTCRHYNVSSAHMNNCSSMLTVQLQALAVLRTAKYLRTHCPIDLAGPKKGNPNRVAQNNFCPFHGRVGAGKDLLVKEGWKGSCT